jgi:hypothetical protein
MAGWALRRRGLLALFLPFAFVCCGTSALSPREAAELAEPHLAAFDEYDRWARRTMLAGEVLREDRSLDEALFAPVRRESAVQAVWVRRIGAGATARYFGALEKVPSEVRWVEVRVPRHGALRVAVAKVPDPRASEGDRRTHLCVLVQRNEVGGGGATIDVIVAYRSENTT